MSHGETSGQGPSGNKTLNQDFQGAKIKAKYIHFGAGNIKDSDEGMWSDV